MISINSSRSAIFGRSCFNKPIDLIVSPASQKFDRPIAFSGNFDRPIDGVVYGSRTINRLNIDLDLKSPDRRGHLVSDAAKPHANQRLQPTDRPGRMARVAGAAFLWCRIQPNDRPGRRLWPASLKELRFGWCFTQTVDKVSWPGSLQELTFGPGFSKKVVSVV